MRKVESNTNAFLAQDIEGKASANTIVRRHYPGGKHDPLEVTLYGKTIAIYNAATNTLYISDAGWRTRTTASRLNALLERFAPAYRIVQRDWIWYLDNLTCEISENVSYKDILEPWEGAIVFHDSVPSGRRATAQPA